MKRLVNLLLVLLLLLTGSALAQEREEAYRLVDEQGIYMATLDIMPQVGDTYITADNRAYSVAAVREGEAVLHAQGTVTLPELPMQSGDEAVSVMAAVRTLSLASGASARDDIVQQLQQTLAQAGAALVTAGDAPAEIAMVVLMDTVSVPGEYDALVVGEKGVKVRLMARKESEDEAFLRQFVLSIKRALDEDAPTMVRDVYLSQGMTEQVRLLYGAEATEAERLQQGIAPLSRAIASALLTGTSGGIAVQGEGVNTGALTGVIFAGGLLIVGVVGYGLLLTLGRKRKK